MNVENEKCVIVVDFSDLAQGCKTCDEAEGRIPLFIL